MEHGRMLQPLRLLSRPEQPRDNHHQLHSSSYPQHTSSADRTPGQDTAEDSTDQEQDGGGHAAIALGVVRGQDLGVGEEVAVVAGEHDAGEGVVLEGAAGDGLPAALEGDEGDGDEDGPVDRLFPVHGGRLRAEGQHGCGAGDEHHLQHEGGAENPAPLGRGRGLPVQGAEEDGADAEATERCPGFDPPRGFVGGGEAKAEVYRVSWARVRGM